MRLVRVVLTIGLLAPLCALVPSVPAVADTCTPPPPIQLFLDVSASHPFCEEIYGVAGEDLVTGYPTPGGFEFRPGNKITRQAVAAVLTRWDLGGDPSPDCSTAPFPDVPVTHPFCGEIFWASDSETMQGFDDGEFKPTREITRQAVAAILVRRLLASDEEPEPCTSAPFPDVPISHPFCAEIAMAADLGVVAGFPDGSYRPGASITRHAFAAMVWRTFEESGAPGRLP